MENTSQLIIPNAPEFYAVSVSPEQTVDEMRGAISEKLVKDDAVSKLNLGPDDEFRITVLRAGERKELKLSWGELQ